MSLRATFMLVPLLGRAGSLVAPRLRLLGAAAPRACLTVVRSGAFDENDLFQDDLLPPPPPPGGDAEDAERLPRDRGERRPFGGDRDRRGGDRDRRGGDRGGGRAPGRCYICGEEGHFARECPNRGESPRDLAPTRVFVSALDERTRWMDLKDHFRDAGFEVMYLRRSL